MTSPSFNHGDINVVRFDADLLASSFLNAIAAMLLAWRKSAARTSAGPCHALNAQDSSDAAVVNGYEFPDGHLAMAMKV